MIDVDNKTYQIDHIVISKYGILLSRLNNIMVILRGVNTIKIGV